MTHGKGRDFKKLPPITLENVKAGHLELLLFETERAWAYSQELYTSSLQPANKEHAGKLRHNATGRFRRSLHWCTQLLSHCQSLYKAQRLSAENILEINAYTLILSGRFLRFRDEYEDALDQLCVARGILDKLAECAESSRDQALATLFSDEIAPEIRYCAHQLGQENAYDIDRIVKEIAPKHQQTLVEGCSQLVERLRTEGRGDATVQGRKRLETLMWDGEPVPVRNPELVDVLLEVQKAEELLKAAMNDTGRRRHQKSRKGVAAFDAILAALSEAEEVARKLAEAQRTTSGSATSPPGTRDIHFLHAFIVYQLLAHRVERDLTLIEALISSSQSQGPRKPAKTTTTTNAKSKSDHAHETLETLETLDDNKDKEIKFDARINPAIVKLLNTVVQTLEHMRSLNIVEDNPDLTNAVETRLEYTKARRCLYLARSYAAVKQYTQALVLCQQSQLYIRATSSFLSSSFPSPSSSSPSASARTGSRVDPSTFYPLTQLLLTHLTQTLSTSSDSFKRAWFAYNGGEPTIPKSSPSSTNASENKTAKDQGGKGKETTKEVKEVKEGKEKKELKKPLFFDIALNYVQLDMDRLHSRAGMDSPKENKENNEKENKNKTQSKTSTAEKPAQTTTTTPVTTKAKMAESIDRPSTPEPQSDASRRGGLSSLLGGWWGRK
ncbi:uncharacterized protein FOMMEDRAFT_122270 [Fomitiporia mediterranea MF3/22]|uniref:uncharacterized protein n=1 Tax=Fomitiporia mediterranea (strain MF3/22) TaxID=694068 RepID=UPI0004407DE1|nr:uncharacterized protein FOMMEDRAFT_122270 [Fomitiporia mediterranea MF3/22]EJD04471.1 hypothetical protein FOMMEDRAFT_122270 [Fomitiporia mediterranea MF3/22]